MRAAACVSTASAARVRRRMRAHAHAIGPTANSMMSASRQSTKTTAAAMTPGMMKASHSVGMTIEATWEIVLTSRETPEATAASLLASNHPRGRVRTWSPILLMRASQTSYTLIR